VAADEFELSWAKPTALQTACKHALTCTATTPPVYFGTYSGLHCRECFPERQSLGLQNEANQFDEQGAYDWTYGHHQDYQAKPERARVAAECVSNDLPAGLAMAEFPLSRYAHREGHLSQRGSLG
jgi:hypothetical protein